MSDLAADVREVLEPVVRAAQVDMGPMLWQRLKEAADAVYGMCEDEEVQASVATDLMHELMNEMEDR